MAVFALSGDDIIHEVEELRCATMRTIVQAATVVRAKAGKRAGQLVKPFACHSKSNGRVASSRPNWLRNFATLSRCNALALGEVAIGGIQSQD